MYKIYVSEMSENGAVEVEITTSYVEDRKAAEQM